VDKYQVCSILGYNLGNYKFNIEKIDKNAKTNQALIAKLKKKKCQLVIGYLEIWQTFEKMGKFDLKGLGFVEIPESKPLEFHAMVSKKYPKAKKVIQIINDGLNELKADGFYKRVFQKYGIKN
jgi:polar amino acid transport system substrate-binding protein